MKVLFLVFVFVLILTIEYYGTKIFKLLKEDPDRFKVKELPKRCKENIRQNYYYDKLNVWNKKPKHFLDKDYDNDWLYMKEFRKEMKDFNKEMRDMSKDMTKDILKVFKF